MARSSPLEDFECSFRSFSGSIPGAGMVTMMKTDNSGTLEIEVTTAIIEMVPSDVDGPDLAVWEASAGGCLGGSLANPWAAIKEAVMSFAGPEDRSSQARMELLAELDQEGIRMAALRVDA
jgi:hypothetical protein